MHYDACKLCCEMLFGRAECPKSAASGLMTPDFQLTDDDVVEIISKPAIESTDYYLFVLCNSTFYAPTI
jgi:hypothetical protein